MKKIRMISLLLCMLMIMQSAVFSVPASAEEADASSDPSETSIPEETYIPVEVPIITTGDASVSNGCHTLDAAQPLGSSEQLLDTAKAAILYELNSKTLLYAWNPDEKLYPASLAKIMTALLVIESGDLSRSVTATESALSSVPYDAMSISIKAGESFTMEDLLYCILVASANDACAVAAEEISGSQEAFVKRMNERAQELGCTNTNFANAGGLQDEQQYTTARDLGKILEAAMEYDSFRAAFGAGTYTVPATSASEARELISNNYFISKASGVVKFYDSKVTGGRSGAVSTTDRSLAVTAQSGDLQLMSIVLGAEGILEEDGYSLYKTGNFEETETLLAYGFNNFEVSQILYEGRSVAQFPVENGENQVVGRPVDTVYSALPAGTTAARLVWKYLQTEDSLSAPVGIGTKVGTVQVWYGTTCLAQSDMVTMNASKVAAQVQSSGNETGSEAEAGIALILKILGVIFAVLIVLILVLIAVRLIRASVIRARRRRRRRNRRRSR